MSEIYISREKAIDAIEREYGDDVMGAIKAKEAIYSVELADCRPVVHGHWVNASDTSGREYFRCSECGTYIEKIFFAHDYPVNCCPCCTAIMDK